MSCSSRLGTYLGTRRSSSMLWLLCRLDYLSQFHEKPINIAHCVLEFFVVSYPHGCGGSQLSIGIKVIGHERASELPRSAAQFFLHIRIPAEPEDGCFVPEGFNQADHLLAPGFPDISEFESLLVSLDSLLISPVEVAEQQPPDRRLRLLPRLV